MSFHIKIALALAAFAMPVATLLAADEGAAPIDAEIIRFLREVQFAHSYKHGIEVVIGQQGRSTAALRAIAAAPDDEIIHVVLPAYRQELTMAQAHALADFYASDAGRAVIRQQVADIGNPYPALALTNEQREAVAAFAASDAGREASRLGRKAFVIEVSQYIAKAFGVRAP
jgi:hypothetical protein